MQFGETAGQAVVREVLEATGVRMEIERLGFLHENYFYGDTAANAGREIYELCFYFYMRVPEDFDPVCGSLSSEGSREYLKWVSPDDPGELYPAFFRTELRHPAPGVRHIVTDDRFDPQRKVTVIVDRPLGSRHPEYSNLVYPVNYGYVKGLMAGGGEEQDAYVLGVAKPVPFFTGRRIAVIHRLNDRGDKWVVAPNGAAFTKEEIAEQVRFQEQYFDTWIEMTDGT